MYYSGFRCTCNNCGRKWVVTYKDIIEYQSSSIQDVWLEFSSLIASWTGTNLTDKKVEMTQTNHCPFCRNTNINLVEFYYEADENGECIREVSEKEFEVNNGVRAIKSRVPILRKVLKVLLIILSAVVIFMLLFTLFFALVVIVYILYVALSYYLPMLGG